jgi:thiamine biosynthesis protein ThiI
MIAATASNRETEGLGIDSSITGDIARTSEIGPDDILVDIRHPADIEKKPLIADDHSLLSIPFFNLEQQFDKLDRRKRYLLYCDKGIMSRLQAQLMREHGFQQVAVYSPKT